MHAGKLLCCLIAALFAAGAAEAWEYRDRRVEASCVTGSTDAVDCDYRLLDGGSATTITARAGTQPLPVAAHAGYPWSGARSALLLVVDTSDPGRQAVIDRNLSQIGALLSAAQGHHRFGLAGFDRQLRPLAEIGSAPDAIRAAAAGLRAQGMTTELYRSLLQAVELLARVPADRRALVVFSDGQPEDRAYFHADVVAAARRAGVVIHSLGFPRSVPLSVSLQTLRRLSEETGGVYVDTDMSFVLPQDFASRILANLDGGGRFTLSGVPPAAGIQLEFDTTQGRLQANMPGAATATPAATPAAARAAVAAAAAPEIRVVTTQAERGTLDTWLWYGIPAALIVLILLTGVTLVLLYRKPAARAAAAPAWQPPKPLAYLIAQDERGTRHAITSTIWRIGRSRDNEMVLDDNSISRRHAEIQRGLDGSFVLIDKESLNGVFVNGEKVGRRALKEGDVLEIGDVFLRFTESPADDQLIEKTSMQHTRAPRAL